MTLYRITVRKESEPRGRAITRIHPLRRARVGLNAAYAMRFEYSETVEVLAALRAGYPDLIFSRS